MAFPDPWKSQGLPWVSEESGQPGFPTSLLDLISCLCWVLVLLALPLFLYHWHWSQCGPWLPTLPATRHQSTHRYKPWSCKDHWKGMTLLCRTANLKQHRKQNRPPIPGVLCPAPYLWGFFSGPSHHGVPGLGSSHCFLSLSPLSSSPPSPLEDFANRVRQGDLVLSVPGLKFSDPPLQSPGAPRLLQAGEAFLAISSTKNQQGPGGYLYQEAPSLLGTCGFQQHFPPSFRLSLIEVSLGQTTCNILCHSFIHSFTYSTHIH